MKQELMAWAASDRHVRPEGRMSGGPDALRGHVFRRTGRFMGVLLLVAPLFLTGLSGCTAGGDYTWGSLYREDVSSVAVPIFTNTTFERGIEFRLTRAVAQQIETRTPWKVTDRRSADTILEGEIISVGSQPISRDRFTTLPQEQLFTIRMN